MVKFVMLRDTEGKEHQVNPDRVAYVKKIATGTAVVFDGVQGGLHQLVVIGGLDEALRVLERRPPPKAPKPAKAA